MDVNSFFNQPRHKISLLALFIAGIIPASSLFFYIFKRDIFLNLDLFRLTSLCFAIFLPINIFFYNLVHRLLSIKHKDISKRDIFDAYAFFVGGLLSFIIFNLVNLLGFFLGFTFFVAVILVISISIILGIILLSIAPKEADNVNEQS